MLEENANEQPRTSQKRSLEEEEPSTKRKRDLEDEDIEEKNEEPRKKRRFDDE